MLACHDEERATEDEIRKAMSKRVALHDGQIALLSLVPFDKAAYDLRVHKHVSLAP